MSENIGRAQEITALDALHDLDTVAVIINVNTRLVATLALVSTLRHCQLPVLMIDCESDDGSLAFFRSLRCSRDFYLLSRPLRAHGVALDEIFASTSCRRLLLVDSDIEIKHDALISKMLEAMDGTTHWGAGFLHERGWLQPPAAIEGWYVERMWIPLVLIDVAAARRALTAGHSFDHRKVPNDVAGWPLLSYLLSLRFVLSWFRARRLRFLERFRGACDGVKPAFIYFDTGADVHRYLQESSSPESRFAALPLGYSGSWLTHLHGVTRKKLKWWDINATRESSVLEGVKSTLHTEYGIAP